MKIITIANQKGGVGKSTLALHLIHYANLQGLNTLFIDLDAQGNSSSSLHKVTKQAVIPAFKLFESEIKIPKIDSVTILSGTPDLADSSGDLGNFSKNLEIVSTQFDLCIIDTAPTASMMQVAPLMVSDYVISPIELANWSYQGSMPFLTMLKNIRKKNGNKKPEFLGLLPSRVWRNSPQQKADYDALVNDKEFNKNLFKKGELFVPLKQCYMEAGTTGQPIWAFKEKSSSRAEGKNMKAVCHAILQSMKVIK